MQTVAGLLAVPAAGGLVRRPYDLTENTIPLLGSPLLCGFLLADALTLLIYANSTTSAMLCDAEPLGG